ncbi:PA2169 family four-helix-bundle protein [Blastopirellula retiformator]|uniref:Putative Mg(2+) transport ATPase n=1 Tax=Blastopirellula retiformator TaxID=2527970 RepID=A0A5C5VM26_9BACT|nr:putative Mg(2+) transport ATPase [Blastopirellula retiformator]
MGGVLGWERVKRQKSVGLRTYMLVSLGSAVLMIVGMQLQEDYGDTELPSVGLDITRVLSAMVGGDGAPHLDRHSRLATVRSRSPSRKSTDCYAILAEAEAGEDHIKHAYEDALKETAGSAMNDVLQKQYAQVKQGHDRIRDMRDAFKAKSQLSPPRFRRRPRPNSRTPRSRR